MDDEDCFLADDYEDDEYMVGARPYIHDEDVMKRYYSNRNNK
jgi:hypothetical protein